MKRTIKRFLSTTSAIILGVIIILLLTFAGNKSNGPLEDLFIKISNQVINVENKIVMLKRRPVRKKALSWFDKYRENKSLFSHPDTIFTGIYDNHYKKSFDNIITLEKSLNLTVQFIHIYTAWGSNTEQRFPYRYAKAIYNLGSTPFITWEPWLNDFDRDEHPELPDKAKCNKNGLKAIANGTYDFYLEKWAEDVKRYGEIIFIRFAHEMNDPYRYPWGPQNNNPKDFIAAWRHVVDYFKKAKVDNVVWVWSPHPAYKNYNDFYPGNDYVDWIGVGCLNYGNVASWSRWWTFKDIFGNYYEMLSSFDKPIAITEFSSLSVGGNRSKWYEDALTDIPKKYPAVKAIMFFNDSQDNTTTYKSLNWSIIGDTLTVNAIKRSFDKW